uniref:hypothetical protein n=2 Tax=Porphyrobacter sp. GA68 TaxID=2883480 RepID=UPI001D183E53|nr:hypothetical protein [Porphyrobacter sp. GA68]
MIEEEIMPATILAAAAAFVCTPIAVWDGDGPIWCAEGPKIRVANIAAREMDETCRPRHPCPAASGAAARDAMVALLGGPRGTLSTGHVRVRAPAMQCQATGGSYERVVATCRLPNGRDLGAAMLATGTVVPWR